MISNNNAFTRYSEQAPAFDMQKHITAELKELKREEEAYYKVKAIYGFLNKRCFDEMNNGYIKIDSPEPQELPIPSKKLLNY